MSYTENDYQDLFTYLQGEFGVTALQSEMAEIINIVKKMQKQENPRPPHHKLHIKKIGGSVTCETTVIACADCGRHLTEPETNC